MSKVNVLVLLTRDQNVAFFISAIRAQAPPKGKGKKRASAPEPQSYDSNDEAVTPSPVASNISPVQLSNHSTVADEKLHPTTNYWIALTKPNGTPANPIFIHRALLDCDAETMANHVHHFYCIAFL